MEEEVTPYGSFLEYSEYIYSILDDIRTLLWAGIGASIFILIKIIDNNIPFLNLLGFFEPLFWIFGGMSVVLLIRYAYPIIKDLKKWEVDFFTTSYFYKLTLLPSEYESDKEKLLDKILSIYVDYNNILDSLSWKEKVDTFTNLHVSVFEEDYIMDVIIGRLRVYEEIGDNINKVFKELSTKPYIIGKVFDKESPVNEFDLKRLSQNIFAVIEDVKPHSEKLVKFFERIFIVSKTGFTEDAIQFAQNKDNWIRNTSFDLITQKNDYYEIEWVR